MQDGEGHRLVELMLGGDDDGIEKAPVSCIIQSIGKRDCGAKVDDVHHQTKGFHTPVDRVRKVSTM